VVAQALSTFNRLVEDGRLTQSQRAEAA
jgi:hypothetical protein